MLDERACVSSASFCFRLVTWRSRAMMNNNGNGRPLSKRKTVQVLVILTILAWATQTLLHQWGFGQVVGMDAPTTQPTSDERSERFVTSDLRTSASSTLDIRSEATV